MNKAIAGSVNESRNARPGIGKSDIHHLNCAASFDQLSGHGHTSDGLTTELQRRRHDTTPAAADATESKWVRVMCGAVALLMAGCAFWAGFYVVAKGL